MPTEDSQHGGLTLIIGSGPVPGFPKIPNAKCSGIVTPREFNIRERNLGNQGDSNTDSLNISIDLVFVRMVVLVLLVVSG